MSTNDKLQLEPTAVRLPFADGEYVFRLTWKGMEEWEKSLDASLMATFQVMVRSGDASGAAVKQTIRLGLIGGGMSPLDALAKVSNYVDDRPVSENFLVALAIIEARLFGNEEHRAQNERDANARREVVPEA